MPWVVDGVKGFAEEHAVDSLVAISFADQELAALLLSFPWVMDGITLREYNAISGIRGTMDEDQELARVVLDLGWVTDEITKAESRTLTTLRDLARVNLAMAWQAIRQPFMGSPFRQLDQFALADFVTLARDPGGRFAALLPQLAGQSWFNDGIDDMEAAVLIAIVSSTEPFREALIETHHVASVPVALPLAGDAELIVVRHTPFPADDRVLSTMEEGVRAIEGFMGIRFPVNAVLLVIHEPDIWSVRSRAHFTASILGPNPEIGYMNALIRANNEELGLSKHTLYHEIAHYYYLGGPTWLSEGAAEFLAVYTSAGIAAEGNEQRIAEAIASRLASVGHGTCGRENIQQHIDDYGGDFCNYALGEAFMLAMYVALGPEGLSAALRDLYLSHQYLDEAVIYHSFLSNAPSGREEVFKTAYRRYHGGPLADSVLADSPDRAALVALYNAANGADWGVQNQNWASNAYVGSWYGVTADPEGRVLGLRIFSTFAGGEIPSELAQLSSLELLDLGANRLSGEIPPELGGLSNLVTLWLGNNQLSGGIPPELAQLTKLESLGLWGNRLGGEIPPELGNLSNLRILSLGTNQLTGQIPPELGSLTGLEQLSLGGNLFTGCIPSVLRNVPHNDLDSLGLPYC